MNPPNPYSPPQSHVADIRPVEASPALWNPNAAANWSLLFSPAFGALVHMKNWQALGEAERASSSKNWAVATLILFVTIALVGALAPASKIAAGLIQTLPLLLLIVWYFASARAQYRYVVEKFGKSYPRRSWVKPLGFAVLGSLAFFMSMAVVGGLVGFLASAV